MRPSPFYNDFDLERLPGSRRTPPENHRSAFGVDRDRILFSQPFRLLQSKTQVFQSGEYDFYRTRLTHSIEVAKISRSICERLTYTHGGEDPRGQVDPDLVEAVGLAHDLGHPPFGHIGERKLNELMAPWGGFEGNAQSLRILQHRFYSSTRSGHSGIYPTRAFLDGILKYKQLWSEARQSLPEDAFPENHFLYDEQADLRSFVLTDAPLLRQPNSLKSLECQIMDWADDTAYSLMDMVDGIHARYLSVERLDYWREQNEARLESRFGEKAPRLLDALRKSILEERFEPKFSAKIGDFISAVRCLPSGSSPLASLSQRHRYRIEIDPVIQAESKLYKTIAIDLIFRSPEIQQIEHKGSFILERLFNALADHYLESGKATRRLGILPQLAAHTLAEAPDEPSRARLLCDHLASLTDGQAIRLYRRLFEPDFGSITDLL